MIAIDMKKPKNCMECRFSDYGHYECWAEPETEHIAISSDQLPSECPLIEVTHATDEILVDEHLIADIFPGELSEGVREIHASRMGKFILDHPEVMKTEYENYGNSSRRYLANCYMVNVNQEAKDGEADNQ